MASLSNSLNFTTSALKSKSLGSRSFRISINPVNGTTFRGSGAGGGGKISFQLPSMSRTYFDLKTATIRGKIKTVNATAANVDYIDTNVYSVIQRMETHVSNQVLDNVPNFNVLIHALRSMNASPLNTNGVSQDLLLNGGDIANPALSQPIGTTGVSFAMPLPSIGLFSIDQLLPADAVECPTITLHLAPVDSVIVQGTDGNTTDYELFDLEMVMNVVELSPESQAMLDSTIADTGFLMDYENVENTSFTKTNTTRSITQNLGTRVSSLSRMLVVTRDSTITQDKTQLSVSNRSHHNLSEASVFIGGTQIPNLPLKMTSTDTTQMLTELLQFEGGIDGFYSSSLNVPALLNYSVIDKLDNTGNAASIVNALCNSLVGTTGAANTDRKNATVGDTAANTNTHIRGSFAANDNQSHFGRVSNYQIENGKLLTNYTGAAGVTRATTQTSYGQFLLGFQLSTFIGNENLYNNLSTIGSNVSLQLKYSADATAASTFDVFSFYHTIVRLDPITRQYSIESM